MEDPVLPTIEQHFGDLTDPRIDRTKLHKLMDILVIAICAVIAGADNWQEQVAVAEDLSGIAQWHSIP